MTDLKTLIAAKMDVTQFLDFLGLELSDILDKFDEEIETEQDRFYKAFN